MQELNSILDTYSEVDEAAEGTLPRNHVSLEGVVRYLIQLVSYTECIKGRHLFVLYR